MRTLALVLLPILLAAQTTISPDRETALIRAVSDDYRRRVTIVENDAAREYLNALAASFRPLLPETVPALTVALTRPTIHQPSRAPAGLPDGHVTVPIPAITAAAEEAEFARHFAHAIAHISLRHGFRAVDRTAQSPTGIPLIFFGGWLCSDERRLLPIAWRTGKQQEEAEAEADAYAGRLMEAFRPNPAFAALRAELRALTAPAQRPTLRRASEAR
ncbi:MAG: hypothetical protein J0L64_13020 [Acidobacteria bacterium]|nr:hypothetical protein [Acidobacteriota bacterium]